MFDLAGQQVGIDLFAVAGRAVIVLRIDFGARGDARIGIDEAGIADDRNTAIGDIVLMDDLTKDVETRVGAEAYGIGRRDAVALVLDAVAPGDVDRLIHQVEAESLGLADRHIAVNRSAGSALAIGAGRERRTAA